MPAFTPDERHEGPGARVDATGVAGTMRREVVVCQWLLQAVAGLKR